MEHVVEFERYLSRKINNINSYCNWLTYKNFRKGFLSKIAAELVCDAMTGVFEQLEVAMFGRSAI